MDGCQSGTKVVPHDSKCDLPLAIAITHRPTHRPPYAIVKILVRFLNMFMTWIYFVYSYLFDDENIGYHQTKCWNPHSKQKIHPSSVNKVVGVGCVSTFLSNICLYNFDCPSSIIWSPCELKKHGTGVYKGKYTDNSDE